MRFPNPAFEKEVLLPKNVKQEVGLFFKGILDSRPSASTTLFVGALPGHDVLIDPKKGLLLWDKHLRQRFELLVFLAFFELGCSIFRSTELN